MKKETREKLKPLVIVLALVFVILFVRWNWSLLSESGNMTSTPSDHGAKPTAVVTSTGKVLPPQGLYDYGNIASDDCLGHLDKMGAAGFKLVLVYASGSSGYTAQEMNTYSDRAQKNGIQAIWDFNELIGKPDAPATAAAAVNIVKNHPATWGYYVGDENTPHQAEDVQAMADAIQVADPNHPRLFVGSYFVEELDPFVESAEVLGLDVYPIGQDTNSSKMVAEVGSVSQDLKRYNAERNKRTAMVLQAFNWAQDSQPPDWSNMRWPTRQEMRGMRDQSLDSDPELILWFSYYYVEGSDQGEHWDDLVWAAMGK